VPESTYYQAFIKADRLSVIHKESNGRYGASKNSFKEIYMLRLRIMRKAGIRSNITKNTVRRQNIEISERALKKYVFSHSTG